MEGKIRTAVRLSRQDFVGRVSGGRQVSLQPRIRIYSAWNLVCEICQNCEGWMSQERPWGITVVDGVD